MHQQRLDLARMWTGNHPERRQTQYYLPATRLDLDLFDYYRLGKAWGCLELVLYYRLGNAWGYLDMVVYYRLGKPWGYLDLCVYYRLGKPWGYSLASALVFTPVLRELGLDRCWLLYSGTGPISSGTLQDLAGYGIYVTEPFGMSEASGRATFFLKVFGRHMSFFGATGTPVLDFWWCLLWFQSQSGFCLIRIAEANVMYVPQDPPLVLLPTSWRPARSRSCPCILLQRWGCRDSNSCSQNTREPDALPTELNRDLKVRLHGHLPRQLLPNERFILL